MLAYIGEAAEYRIWQVILQLCKISVWPYFGVLCTVLLAVCYTKNEVLERMQKGLSRRLPGLESISPKEKLVRHGLFSLEQRRP